MSTVADNPEGGQSNFRAQVDYAEARLSRRHEAVLDSAGYAGRVILSTARNIRPARAGVAAERLPRPADLVKVHTSPRPHCEVEVWHGATVVKLRKEGERPSRRGRNKRGRVRGFSRKSRGRFMECLNKVEKDSVPTSFFVSLTFPDRVPSMGDVKRFEDVLFKRVHRRFPEAGILWHRELKRRKSGSMAGKVVPHHHDLIFGAPWEFPVEPCAGQWRRVEVHGDCHLVYIAQLVDGRKEWHCHEAIWDGRDNFEDWLAREWYEVVASGDVRHFAKSFGGRRPGCHVVRCRDGGVKQYVCKSVTYISKGSEECVSDSEYYVGMRAWGVRYGQNIPWGHPEIFSLSLAVFNILLRMGSKYIKSRSPGRRGRCWSYRFFVGDVAQWLKMIDYFAVESFFE